MEIIQTIWNVLTSENQILVNIISIPLTFIEIYLTMSLFLHLLNISCNFKQKIIFVVLFSIISIGNMLFANTLYYTFLNILIMPLLVYIIFKANILKSIVAEVISYISVLIVSVPLVLLYSKLFNISSIATTTVPIHKLFVSIILYVCLYVIYRLLKKFNITFSILDKLKNKNFYMFILNFVVGSLSIGLEAFLLFKYIDFVPNPFVFISLFVLLLYFGISMFSLIRTSKLEITTQNLEEEKLYNQTLTTLHDNIRGFKHDFNNIVQAIGGYISTNNMEGLKLYYKDLLEECQINNNLAVLNPELINNPAIYSLLADKYYKADSQGIKLNLEVFADLSNLNIKTYELTRILGILLDNALEAASICDKKLVNVTFRNNKNYNNLLIIIQNTYTNKEINIDRIFEKGYSSKETSDVKQSHGLGLWEVRKYLRKHTNLDLYTTKTDEFFTQQFEIYN